MDPSGPADPSAESAAQRVAVYQGIGCVGCGSVVLLIFSMLAYTVWRADALFLEDPTAVVAKLQEIVPSEVPDGYRGLQGTNAPELKIAILGPADYEGKVLKVDVPLLISAWSWSTPAEDSVRRDEVVAFWKGRVLQRLGEVKELRTVANSVELQVRGATILAAHTELVCDEGTLRAVTLVLPRSGGPQIGLSFLGTQDGFDEAAMKAFLASIR